MTDNNDAVKRQQQEDRAWSEVLWGLEDDDRDELLKYPLPDAKKIADLHRKTGMSVFQAMKRHDEADW